eukprot:PhM_4_TR6875/c0_g1_i1/m.77606
MLRRSVWRLCGYKFFEDQFPRHEEPPAAYKYYEDQMAAASVTSEPEPGSQLTKEQKVKRMFKWEDDEKGVPTPSHDWGWKEETWGPSPYDPGHNTWYNKSRMYMSYDEKTKHDLGHARPLKRGELRQNPVELNYRLGAATVSAQQTLNRQPDQDQWMHLNRDEQQDTFGTVRQGYMDEWLAQPGVEPKNVGKKISEYYGTDDKHTVQQTPRRPDWELPPAPDAY